MENNTLKNKTIESMIWSFMDNIGSQFIQLLIQLFLARLLTPTDFGIIGMVSIFIVLSQVFIDSGFTNGLIREKEVSQDDYSTIFFFNLFTATVLYVLLFASAGFISRFFAVPQLVPIVRVLGLVLIINACGLIQTTILVKKINFRVQMKVNLFSSLFSGGIAIAMAYAGFGVWSLVMRTLIMQVLQAISYTLINRWVPSWVFNIESFKRLFSFGWKLLVSSLLSRVYENIYAVIIGRGFSTVSLGFYTNARRLSDTFSYSVASSVEKVSYPVLSNIQDDPVRLKNGFRKIIKNSVFIAFPVMLGLAAVAPPMFRLLLGDNWIPAIPYFQILSLSGMLTSLNAINLNILQVKGRSDLFLKLSLYRKLIGLAMIGIVMFFQFGVMGLLWALVIDSYICYFVNSFHSKALISYSALEQINDIKLIFMNSVIMAVVTYSLSYLLPINDFFMIIVQITVGIFIYILLSYVLKVEELTTIYDILKPIQKKLMVRQLLNKSHSNKI